MHGTTLLYSQMKEGNRTNSYELMISVSKSGAIYYPFCTPLVRLAPTLGQWSYFARRAPERVPAAIPGVPA